MHVEWTADRSVMKCWKDSSRWRCLVIAAISLLALFPAEGSAAELTSRQLLPSGATAILEVRQPQIAFQHMLIKRLLPILEQSRAYRDAIGNPDLDIVRDSIQHFESQLGILLPQILEACAGEGLLISATLEQQPQFAAVLTGRDPALVARLPEVTLSLVRKIVAGKGQNLPEPIAKSHQGHAYFQFGEIFYATSGPRWLLANREPVLQGMLERLDGKQLAADSGTDLVTQLSKTANETPGVRLIVDVPKLKQFPQFQQVTKWPPQDIGLVILAAGWLDLVQRSPIAIAEIDLGHDSISASLKFTAVSENPTPGTAGYFAGETATAAAPLLEPPHVIYSLSWYRNYWKMWENRELLPMPQQVKQLEMQIAAVEKGNLGYSGFDMLRLIGPHHRIIVTRPGPNPYKVEMPDRLPNVALVLDLKDEQEFKDKVLGPIQRILGIVAVTNKMVGQTIKHQNAEISALRFTEDPAAVKNSDRVRYNFEPSYSVTRGHLIVGSTSHIVRTIIDEMDRLQRDVSPSS
ncbi:MAG: hypothetical protein JWM11_2062, partial [Planctomycetaceae bacterium]|nr:hypothetical protein [Planctomycetaceae bacterium]